MLGKDYCDLSNNELFAKLLKAIKDEGKSIKEDIKLEIQAETEKLSKSLSFQTEKLNNLEKKCNQLESHQLSLERQLRKNNIIIFGLKTSKDTNLVAFVIESFKKLLDTNIAESDLNNVFVLKSEKSTPIKVEFISYLKKRAVFNNVDKLKGSKIFIANDLCYDDRQDEKLLRQHLKSARSQNLFAKIKGRTLQVNDDCYTVEQLKEMNAKFEGQDVENSEILLTKSNSAPSTPNPKHINFEEYFEDNTQGNSASSSKVFQTCESEVVLVNRRKESATELTPLKIHVVKDIEPGQTKIKPITPMEDKKKYLRSNSSSNNKSSHTKKIITK